MGRPRKQKADNGGKTPEPRITRRTSGAIDPPYDATTSKTKTAAAKPSKMTQAGVKKSTGGRRGPARSTKKDPWSEEQLTTSNKSHIIDVDLVKLLSNPKAWTCLDEDEKKEIIALLPDDIQRHADPPPTSADDPNYVIPPLPESFVRYSNNWRDAVRQFQLDLQTGRYDPEWQRQAAEAMEERADGQFDKFKEEQFEEFWGQKQKLDHAVIAGESSKVKLATLVENGVVRIGDVWRYSRVFGKGEKLLLEKEARIVESDGASLTFAIAPGRRVFLLDDSHSANGEGPTVGADVDMKEEVTGTPENGVNGSTPSPEQAAEEDNNNTSATSVTRRETSMETTNQTIDGANADEDVPSEMPTQPEVPTSQAVSESAEDTGPVGVESPEEPTLPEPDPMNVDNPEVTLLQGIYEAADALSDSDSELSTAKDISSPAWWGDENELPATAAADIGVTVMGEMDETQPSDAVLNQLVGARNSDNPTPLLSDAAGAVGATHARDAGIDALPDDAELRDTGEAARSEIQSSTNAAVDGTVSVNQTSDIAATEQPTEHTDEPIIGQTTEQTKEEAAELAAGPTAETTPKSTAESIENDAPKNVIFTGVTGPGRLASKILEIDGRVTDPPNGNAWKEFRCYRNNQDMGSLWECRQAWFVRRK
ncbi:hypothetical protein AJ79_05565 [Helicocarpus griseus UAMH5409]|uniref:DEUBAD domain-containing protein n=1 Tax=Helicocarpus griseus UAMH5409 TaxID=1447875 RepID=A0A2B7XLX5_9EURO|nr:hypothetical protein AJ79_05565 [Helicocarpus griseus UAMH5409]